MTTPTSKRGPLGNRLEGVGRCLLAIAICTGLLVVMVLLLPVAAVFGVRRTPKPPEDIPLILGSASRMLRSSRN